MITNKQQLSPGTLIDSRYIIIRPLGQGGMAYVYLAQDQTSGNQVAVKVMKDDLTEDPEFIKRFDTEARAASSLDHPNIVKILGYGQDNGLRYMVQEYVEGCTLKDLIQEKGALDWSLAVPLAIQIGLALEHAHKRGVVHRDIKPHNILITPDRIAKVTDFGIARASNVNTITLTSGVAFGSVHYFSPEQARGGVVTEKSDIYSLGIMLYEMLTGIMPFDGETSVAVAIKHLQEMPPTPSVIRPGLPTGLDHIIMKCIQKNAENRYLDARELVDELDAFMIDPNGSYGQIAGHAEWEGNTTAIGLQRPESNYGKLKEIEKTINDRRRSRYRDTAIVIGIIAVALVFLTTIFVWGWQKIQDNLSKQTDEIYVLDNYVGMNADEVEALLTEAGIKVERVYREDSVAEGIVLEQNPAATMTIRPGGTPVTLTISGGKNLIIIPSYAGQTETMARTELEQTYGLVVKPLYEPSEYEKGIVIKTIPAAGQTLSKGEEITLVVSAGLTKLLMPDLVGKSFSEAKTILAGLNLVIGPLKCVTVDPLTNLPVAVAEADRVILAQTLPANTPTLAQTVIGLTYGTAQDYQNFLFPSPTPVPMVTMPDLSGQPMTAARAALTALGLNLVETVSMSAEPNIPENKQIVILQNFPVDAQVSADQPVILTYGTAQDYQAYLNPTPTPEATTLPPPPAPAVTNDDSQNTVAGMTTAMEYRLDSASSYTVYAQATFAQIDFSGGHELYVRYAQAGSNPASLDTVLIFTKEKKNDIPTSTTAPPTP